MKSFAYAAPRTEQGVLGLLSAEWGSTEILAGGTDLIGLMKKMIVTPERVVNIKEVDALRGITADSSTVQIGAVTTLDDVLESPHVAAFPAVRQAIAGIASQQLQSQGTIGGELCQRPRCWYFRNGQGLLAGRGWLTEQGDNRYHAILGNEGPAKFVSASRLAPALIALDAQVRIIGPGPHDESHLPLAMFFRTPGAEHERETILRPSQLLTHIVIPRTGRQNAHYEVRHGEGPDYPLAAAAVSLDLAGGVVRGSNLVMGQVAPIPWVAREAAEMLLGRAVDAALVRAVGERAVQDARPLAHNDYKVQLARVCVERALFKATGLPTGGF